MSRPETVTEVPLTGRSLTIEQVVAVARHRARVTLTDEARRRVLGCRAMVDLLLARGEKVYGLTTGFGKLRDVTIAREDVEKLQVNLIRSHAAGVGQPFDEDVVRGAILLRANTLARGNSGIRLETLEALIALLNDGVYPWVPQQGSVGCSGDLAPLSHLALVLMGDPGGRVFPRGLREGDGTGSGAGGAAIVRQAREADFVPADRGWAEAGLRGAPSFRPVVLQAKEGLALNNGTQVMTAIGCLAIHDAETGLAWSERACAISLEAQRGVKAALSPEVHAARDLPHQAATAARILAATQGSQVLDVLLNTAYLRRARAALTDVHERLQQGDAPAKAAKAAAGAAIEAARAELERLLPIGATTPPAAVLALGDRPFRQQVQDCQALLQPARRAVVAAAAALEQAEVPPPPSARDGLARALSHMAHAAPSAPPVQDDYSLRCAPQVLACAHRALAHTREVVSVEINAATDNPLLFPPEPQGGWSGPGAEPAAYARLLEQQAATLPEKVIGGGNFHGEPIAKVMDYLAIAFAEVGSIAERRVAHLVDEGQSNGLPPFLVPGSGLNSGFMIPQYTAAALVSENKVLCHPASVDSIPTCAGSEDHNSMGTIAARKAAQVVENVLQVIAIELCAAQQGLSFRAPLRSGKGVVAAVSALREAGVTPFTEDKVLVDDMKAARELIRRPPPA